MKSLIFFALIAVCSALPHAFIADTPEVQAERQRFYQLYNKAAEAAAAAPDTNVYGKHSHSQYQQPRQSYTPQAHNYQSGHNVHRFNVPQHHHQPQQYTPKWNGPLASKVPAGLPGSVPQVANTPEVDAAIASFNKAYSSALQTTRSAAPHPNTYHQGHYSQQPSYQQGHYNHHSQPQTKKWTGPLASTIPAGLPGSPAQVSQTAEVQAARAHFGQAYQNQLMSVLG